jgi:hypothetical protein
MADITEISAMVAAAGVLVGVVYYILDMRYQRQERRKDLVIGLSSELKNREFLEASVIAYEAEFGNYDEFVKKYGKFFSTNKVPMAFMMIGNYYEQVGVLLRNRLIEPSLIEQLIPVSISWEKMATIIEEVRKEYHDPHLWEWFEYLYKEMKKREQRK